MLLLVAVVIIADYKKTNDNKKNGKKDDEKAEGITWYKTLHKIHIPSMMEFKVSEIRRSVWLPVFVTFFTGVMAGFLGVGGSFLRMPALVFLVGCPTHVAVGTDLFEVMISGLYGTLTYGVKGRIEIYAVAVMLSGAAIGAQIGSVATKYATGPGIRVAFALTAVACMISVILKQFSYTIPATVVIMSAVSLMCVYISIIMVRGVARELKEK